MNVSSSLRIPTLFIIFAFSQNGHLKNGFVVGSTGMPSVHFLVSFIVVVPQWSSCWCNNSKSFILWENRIGGKGVVSCSNVGGAGISVASIIDSSGSVVMGTTNVRFVLLLMTWSSTTTGSAFHNDVCCWLMSITSFSAWIAFLSAWILLFHNFKLSLILSDQQFFAWTIYISVRGH